jgi:hypothetical protein
LIFTDEANATEFHASIVNITVDNPILVTAASASLECSFAGGCSYEVHAQGLSALMKQNNKDHYVNYAMRSVTMMIPHPMPKLPCAHFPSFQPCILMPVSTFLRCLRI